MILGDVQTIHTRRLWEDFIAGHAIDSSSLPDYVFRSWETCKSNDINPHQTLKAQSLNKAEINELLHQNEELIEISKPVLEMMLFSTQDAQFIVMLTSNNGVILHVTGDLESLSIQENHYNKPGVFCERNFFSARATTLSLVEKKPVALCGSEHYLEVFHNSLCYAAPIFNHNGQVEACISLATSIKNYNKKTLSMVTAAAENISIQIQKNHLYETKNYFSSLIYSICDSLPDAVIALDKNNTITYVNITATDILHVPSDEIIGKNITDIIDSYSMRELSNLISSKKKSAMSICLMGKKEQKWLCRAQPLNDPNNITIGATLFLASEKQIIQGITQVGGNRAHFSLDDIKGESPQIQKCIQFAKKIANKASRVLLTGESGTGKELFAQGIHNASPRRSQPFVAISCASIPRDLIEAELFGYVSGSFTGANKNGAMGKFELAHNGTLFLDEIGSLPMEAQGKLLRALQQNEITRIGGKVPTPVNVNVISANNIDLHELVRTKSFREDLLYRLNSIEIHIPPLRDREGDTEFLIRYFVKNIANAQGRNVEISHSWMNSMLNHNWGGNVRELEHACEAALILCDDNYLSSKNLPHSIKSTIDISAMPDINANMESFDENFRKWFLTAISTCNGNLSTMSKNYGIPRSTLYRKLKLLNIDAKLYREKK